MTAKIDDLFKYVQSPSRERDESRSIEAARPRLVSLLTEAVAIPSVSADPARRGDVVRMVEWTKKELERLGASCELAQPGEQVLHDGRKLPLPPILFATLGRDPSKKTVLVYAHLDVQPADKKDGWNTEPFQLTEKDGKLYGRGSTDDKGPMIGWIVAIEKMKENGIDIPVNIKFVLEAMEESGSEGLEETLKKKKASRPLPSPLEVNPLSPLQESFLHDVSFSCISDNYWLGKKKPCLTYGLRGISYYFVEVSCAKQDLHSGVYGGSVHEAMADLVWILSQLSDLKGNIHIPGLEELIAPLSKEESNFYEAMDFDKDDYARDIGAHGLMQETKEEVLMAKMRRPSLSIHGVEGAFSGAGGKTVIPSTVIGKFSIRLVPHMEPEAVDKLVLAHLDRLWKQRGSPNHYKSRVESNGRPWVGDFRDANFQAGARAIKRVFDVEPDYTREGCSIPITLTLEDLTGKSVVLLPIGACDDMAHSQNEKINVSNLVQGTKTLAAYLLELGSA